MACAASNKNKSISLLLHIFSTSTPQFFLTLILQENSYKDH